MIERPVLTYIPEVGEWVREVYSNADIILEYGSGGSTVLAAEMPGKTIFSVESDKAWTDNMIAYFEQQKPPAKVVMHHVNIGKTGKWGTPIDTAGFKRYHRYPLSIWDHPEFEHPDVIMVDGRFRVACALTAMLRCTKKTALLFDDYKMRKAYHALEEYLKPVEMRGNMARFEVKPQSLPRAKMTGIIGAFARHF
ncbi:MAG: hypothetical protein WBN04_13235 [Paracoccaceae bacterium]